MPIPTTVGLAVSLALAAAPPPPAASATAVADPELAALAPRPAWVPEGGDKAHRANVDPRALNKKLRSNAIMAVGGFAIAVVGLAAAAGGLYTLGVPKKRLARIKSEHDGALPPGDPARQRMITLAKVSPILLGTGLGLVAIGGVLAIVGGRRVKTLREEKRTTVAFTPTFAPTGLGLAAQVRF